MKMYFVLNARLPNKKAYGIHAAKMCEAFIEAGVDLTLVVPRTRAARSSSIRDFYDLRVDVPTVMLPALDWYGNGRIPFLISSLTFMALSFMYLLYQSVRGAPAVIYTVDMDSFSFALLPFTGMRCVAEFHLDKPNTWLRRLFFRQVASIVVLNDEIKRSLAERFDLSDDDFLVEPCGVDASWFSGHVARGDARKKLSLPEHAPIASYVGRFYDWKGLDVIPAAFGLIPDIHCYLVGGSREQFQQATGVATLPPNVHVVGECAYGEVPTWLAASDALLVLGTTKNKHSSHFTAPMKMYEYMAARRPVVASGVPALRSFVSSDEVLFYEPDSADDLARVVRQGVEGGRGIADMVERAYVNARRYTWAHRAARIVARIAQSSA